MMSRMHRGMIFNLLVVTVVYLSQSLDVEPDFRLYNNRATSNFLACSSL